MEPRIINNKVYESLQTPTEHARTTTGKVLYANRYSGIAQKAMPADLKALIDSDFGLVGKNILIQLEQKMKGYHNGPWYVDSRDGVIYIHNRKFHEEPVTTYHYQNENGEVLRVTFTTQEVTKHVKATLSHAMDPDTKDMITVSTGIQDPDIKKEEVPPMLANPDIAQVDNTMVSNIGGNGYEDYRSHPTLSQGELWKMEHTDYQAGLEKRWKYAQAVAEYGSQGPVAAYENGRERALNAYSTEEMRDMINKAVNQLPEDKRAALAALLNNPPKNPKELEAKLKKILENERFLFVGEDQMEFMVTEWVDPKDYDPQKATSYKDFEGAGVSSGLNFQTQVLPASERGFKALKDDPYTEVYTDMEIDTNKHYGQGQYGKKVKVRHMKKVNYKVPIYKLYNNLFSRAGGVDKWAWAANANANGGLKLTEKRLICQMQVVGRPLLESSQIINLQNVGKRWSGYWYIKTCTHQMDAGQGYITEMELIRNNAKAGQTTSKAQLSTQDVVVNEAKVNSKTDKGKDKKSFGTTDLKLKFTFDERMYVAEKFYTEDGKLFDTKGLADFMTKKAYYTELNANDPVALEEGIIVSSGNTITSEGELIPGKVSVKDIKVPDNYHIKFDYTKMAMKLYFQYKKNKKK